MKTVIMAGGKGTRIQEVASDIPKPMIHINGKPILEWQIMNLKEQGFLDIIITVGYLKSAIMDYFGDGSEFGVSIEYFEEERALGNAGALFKISEKLTDDFLLINGDVIFDVDFNRMIAFHNTNHALITLLVHPNSHPYDSGLLMVDSDCVVKQWLTKEDSRPKYYKNCVNAGIHVINKKALDMAKIDVECIGEIDKQSGEIYKVDLDRQILKPLISIGKIIAYTSSEYVKDMGTPERFYVVENDMKSGLIMQKSYRNKQKAVFLDRDGTINKYVGFLRDTDGFDLFYDTAKAIRTINESGYLCIVVTNQPVIARGEVTWEELENIHNKMETLLGFDGAYVDGIYVCPHHPHKGYEGEIEALKIECNCRKPKPGMLLKAAQDFNIDLNESWMIGDSENDIRAGKTAGCKTVLIDYAQQFEIQDYEQDDTVFTLEEFVEKYIC